MNANHMIEIGSTHSMCQDYALSGDINDDISYAIISDGCSSSENVDIGARLLCFAVKQYLFYVFKEEKTIELAKKNVSDFEINMWSSVLKNVKENLYSIDPELTKEGLALDCTLLVAVSDINDTATFQQGDGGVIIHNKDDTAFRHIEFTSGAPYYLSYEIDITRNGGYMAHFGYEPVIVWNDQIKGGVVYRNIERQFPFLDPEALNNYTSRIHSNILGVTLVTDGVNSFQSQVSKKDWKNLGFGGILPSLVKYKNFGGEFVQRRFNGFKQNMNKLHGSWRHYDDLAVASIHIRKI